MQIAIEVLDPSGVERRRAPAHAVHRVALLQQKLGQVCAVLPGHTGDKRNLRHNDPARKERGLV